MRLPRRGDWGGAIVLNQMKINLFIRSGRRGRRPLLDADNNRVVEGLALTKRDVEDVVPYLMPTPT